MENLRAILDILNSLTPDQRKDLLDKIEEVYCLECGKETRFCTCDIDDRW